MEMMAAFTPMTVQIAAALLCGGVVNWLAYILPHLRSRLRIDSVTAQAGNGRWWMVMLACVGITHCTEVLGMEGETILSQDIFKFEEEGMDDKGKIVGQLRPTGIRPKALDRMKADQVNLPADLFTSGLRRHR
jgi:hypothetical protein